MRTARLLLGALLAAVLVGAVAVPVRADVTITMENEVESPAGTQKETVTQYFTPTKMRSDHGEASVSIIDLDAGRMITLMPALKTYFVQTIEAMKQQAAVIRMAKPEISVEETEETEEINGYTCQKVIVRTKMATHEMVMEHWMAKVEGVGAVFEFQTKMAEMFKDVPQVAANLEVTEKFAAEGRFPMKIVVRTKMPDGEAVSTMTVTKIEEGELDESLFEIPEGYTEQTLGGVPGSGPDTKE